MIKKLRVAVDHGNRNMKTCHFIFTSGLNVLDKKPARGEQYLQFGDKYYTLSEQRIPYQRDKTLDFRFLILTLFAIAMELEGKEQIQPEDVVQIQLPPFSGFRIQGMLAIKSFDCSMSVYSK